MVQTLTKRGSTSPSLAELLVEAIEARVAELHTGLPAKVVEFDPAKQSCNVQPLLLHVIIDENEEEVEERYPQITNVPVLFPSGGGWSFIFPLKPGDIVFLTFAERSLDRWLEGTPGQEISPQHTRKLDITDAVCVPALRPRVNPIAELATLGDDMRIGRDGGNPALVLKANGDVEIGNASGDASIVIKANGDLEIGRGATEKIPLGNLLIAAIQAITVPTAFGPSGPPINAASFPATLSPKKKVS